MLRLHLQPILLISCGFWEVLYFYGSQQNLTWLCTLEQAACFAASDTKGVEDGSKTAGF